MNLFESFHSSVRFDPTSDSSTAGNRSDPRTLSAKTNVKPSGRDDPSAANPALEERQPSSSSLFYRPYGLGGSLTEILPRPFQDQLVVELYDGNRICDFDHRARVAITALEPGRVVVVSASNEDSIADVNPISVHCANYGRRHGSPHLRRFVRRFAAWRTLTSALLNPVE